MITLFNEHKVIPKQFSAGIQKWAMLLYAFSTLSRPGISMSHADALSRLPETEGECEKPEEIVFLMAH